MSWRDELNRTLRAVPDDDLCNCLGELEKHRALIWLRLQQNGSQPEREADVVALDRYFSAKELHERLGMSEKFLYDHQRQMGAVKLGGSVRFPERGVMRYLASQQ